MGDLNKYLLLARRAREENNAEDAKKYYDMVRTEDPDNAEAKFFYSYYRMFSDTQGHAYDNFSNFCSGIKSTVAMILASNDSLEEKTAFFKTIIECAKTARESASRANIAIGGSNGGAIVRTYRIAMNELFAAIIVECRNDIDILFAYYEFKVYEADRDSKHGYMTKYTLADEIESKFPSEPKLMAFALKLWKDTIASQQKYYGGTAAQECLGYPEKYAEKVKKYEPDYQMPPKAQGRGCITIGKK